MAIYAMSDLHLSLSADKPMDVFGNAWQNYMERIRTNWTLTVSDDDLVIVGGDISWAMYLEDTYEDLKLLDSLPGKKLLLRGNHDYWWMSIAKMKAFFEANSFHSLEFLQNDALCYGDAVIAGTRGWINPSSDSFTSKDRKIYDRELIRLELSLKSMKALEEKSDSLILKKIVVLHYPPVNSDGVCDPGILSLLHDYGVTHCTYGHLHGPNCLAAFSGVSEGINFVFTSADGLGFRPLCLDF